MKLSKIFFKEFNKKENFIIGENNFSNLQIKSTKDESFYYFFDNKNNKLIKQFILLEKERVDYVCQVTLIKKGEKFTPRLTFSVRDKSSNILKIQSTEEEKDNFIKANVCLNECHDNFWKLVSFIQSLKDIEIPKEKFSLISQGEGEIVSAMHGRDTASIISIIKQLSSIPGVSLSQDDLNIVIKRRERLEEFKKALTDHDADENWWQVFFEQNKWIFGYGLNYQILRQEQSQAHYGGEKINGKGGQKGDYLTSTLGDINFTVLVEIKTPKAPLLQGSSEIRNGAWSLSKNLTDSISQIEANMYTWEKHGSEQPDNRDKLEKENIFTVQPKGIIVIGSLSELASERDKRETFQRFRKSIHGIDIITFDELYRRASFIVENKE
jgi:hypothetical protein